MQPYTFEYSSFFSLHLLNVSSIDKSWVTQVLYVFLLLSSDLGVILLYLQIFKSLFFDFKWISIEVKTYLSRACINFFETVFVKFWNFWSFQVLHLLLLNYLLIVLPLLKFRIFLRHFSKRIYFMLMDK